MHTAIASFFLLGLAVGCSAQEPGPIEVVGTDLAYRAGQSSQCVWKLANRTSKLIVGYVLVIRQVDEHGKPTHTLSETRITGLEPPPARQGFTPGEAWQHRSGKIVTDLNSVKATVDFVLFSDKSSWGPDSARKAERLRGIREGWSSALATMKTKLDEEGARAVLESLNHVK